MPVVKVTITKFVLYTNLKYFQKKWLKDKSYGNNYFLLKVKKGNFSTDMYRCIFHSYILMQFLQRFPFETACGPPGEPVVRGTQFEKRWSRLTTLSSPLPREPQHNVVSIPFPTRR
jgi:hypothetical protein